MNLNSKKIPSTTNSPGDSPQEAPKNIVAKVSALEAYFKKDLLTLLGWRESFAFPLKKVGGFPALDLDDFAVWQREWGIEGLSPEAITTETLDRIHERRRIELMEDRALDDISEISQLSGYAPHAILKFCNNYSGCPISRSDDKKYRVNAKALRLWFFDNNIALGVGHDQFPL